MSRWINTGRSAADAYQAFQNALLDQPEMKRALAIHIRNLDLQRQINKNPDMTEERAFQIIRFEIQKFERNMQTSIKQAFPPNILNQEDLSNPLNMDIALNTNPNSYASMQMNSMTGALIESLNTEASNIEQAQLVEADNLNQQIQQQPTPDQDSAGYESDSENDEEVAGKTFEYAAVGEVAKEAIEAFARGDEKGEVKAVADITEKVTGKKVDLGEFLKDDKKAEQEESRVFANVPKPPRDIET